MAANNYDDDFNPDPFGYERAYEEHTRKRRPRRHSSSDEGAQAPRSPDRPQAADTSERHCDPTLTHADADTRSPRSDPPEEHTSFPVPDPWLDAQRAAPRELIQFGVFGPHRRDREPLANQRLETNANVRLWVVKGETLSQLDLDTWMSVIQLGRHGGPIRTTPSKLLRLWGRARGGHAKNVLRESLERLGKYRIKLEVENRQSTSSPEKKPDRYGYEGLLIDSVTWHERDALAKTNDWIDITLNPRLAALFQPHRRTHFLASKRAAIGDHPVALWMYGVIRSHRELRPRPPAYYHRMSGSRSCLSDFTHQLERALSLLAKEQLLFSAEIRGGKLFVQRDRPSVPTPLPRKDTEWFVTAKRPEGVRLK